ncbi:N-acetylneuraminate synthase family protein [Candidatus Pelagibacter sp.]|nr:N-acetylneuraminate synthase family protein [Candidatus Pelagibacter sp.]
MKKIFIIGEIGINHNGDIKTCEDLIKTAKVSGCDAVKFQKRDINKVYTQEYLDATRESPWGKTQRDQKLGLEFDLNDYKQIDLICKKLNIEWFASAWDLNSQDFLKKFDTKYNKIASPMIVYEELLFEVAKEKKHTFISTGMCEIDNIQRAVEIFKKENCSFELMHCISTYPMKPEDANLRMIETLRKKFSCDVGYSGHESGLAISVAASSLGITSLERHITLDRTMYGSDQSASIEPNGLKNLIDQVRKVEKAMGDGIKIFSEDEKVNAEKLRQHIY